MKTKEEFESEIRKIYVLDWVDRTDPFYNKTYDFIKDYFESVRNDFTISSFYQGLLIVYGWMPRIPKGSKLFDDKVDASFIKVYDTTRTSFDKVPLADMMAYTNNSIVGLSKMLHFMNPTVYLIWDSNIARVFGFQWSYQINNLDNYINYVKSVHAIAGASSDLRSIEKQLFYLGQQQKIKDKESKKK